MTSPRVFRTLAEAVGELGEAVVYRTLVRDDWYAGDLSYRMSALQQRVRAHCYGKGPRLAGWLTSRRAGKTRTGGTVAEEKGIWFPGIYIPYAAPTATQVETFVHPHFWKMADEAPPELAWDLNQGKWVSPPMQWYDQAGRPVRSKIHGGVELARFRGTRVTERLRQSVINPRGCEDQKKADALRGTGTVFAVVDEARDIRILRYVLQSVILPMLWEARAVWGDDCDPHCLVITTAPREPDHPFVDVWEGMKARGSAIHTTIWDADHLTQQDIEDARLEAGGEHTLDWRREALAIIERDPKAAMFPEFSDRHIQPVEPPEFYWPTVVGDSGFIDLAWFGFCAWNFRDAVLEIYDEITFQRSSSDQMGAAIAKKELEVFGDREVERRRVDAKPQVRMDMNRPEWGQMPDELPEGVEPPHWTGVIKPGGRRGEGSLEAGVNELRVLMRRDQLRIHPRCLIAISHLGGARWNHARDAPVWVRSEDKERLHHYDGAVGVVYAAREVNRRDLPYPAPEVLGFPTHLPPKRRAEPTEEEKIFSRRSSKSGARRRRRR